jgi:hypothetical protein
MPRLVELAHDAAQAGAGDDGLAGVGDGGGFGGADGGAIGREPKGSASTLPEVWEFDSLRNRFGMVTARP